MISKYLINFIFNCIFHYTWFLMQFFISYIPWSLSVREATYTYYYYTKMKNISGHTEAFLFRIYFSNILNSMSLLYLLALFTTSSFMMVRDNIKSSLLQTLNSYVCPWCRAINNLSFAHTRYVNGNSS